MFDQNTAVQQQDETRSAQEWVRILAKYRDPSLSRSWFEVAVTFGAFALLWAVAWWAMSISYWLTLGISLVNAGFLLRLFVIQHDCGHGSFFKNRHVNDWVGRVLGVVTLTPYDQWRRAHSIHHSASGNLERRGMGDIHTITVAEYQNLSARKRFKYRLYRNPITLFALGPAYVFFLENRLPLGFMNGKTYWFNSLGTNLALAIWLGTAFYFAGLAPILLIFVPSTLLAATAGVWLFYVQHQFETTNWDGEEDWQLHEAALHGSSHYVLPPVLQWMSGNIGIHHVHHLYSRVPFYRLPEVLRDHATLSDINRMSIRQSLKSVRLHLWDENSRRLVSFAHAKAL